MTSDRDFEFEQRLTRVETQLTGVSRDLDRLTVAIKTLHDDIQPIKSAMEKADGGRLVLLWLLGAAGTIGTLLGYGLDKLS